jgi:acid phosphatase (class A)
MKAPANRLVLALLVLLATPPVQAADKGPANFVDVAALDLTRLIPPPPAQDSAITRQELADIKAAQAAASPERRKIAEEDYTETVFAVMRGELGPVFNAERLPVTAGFFKRVLADEGAVVDPAKAAFGRQRPFQVDSGVVPCPPAKTSGAYPSGHATVGYLAALTLADMIPERRDVIFAAAARYAESRIVCGVHYKSDVNASMAVAAAMTVQMRTNQAYRREFDASRAELRTALGLGS